MEAYTNCSNCIYSAKNKVWYLSLLNFEFTYIFFVLSYLMCFFALKFGPFSFHVSPGKNKQSVVEKFWLDFPLFCLVL